MFGRLRVSELILILDITLVVFGTSKLSEKGEYLGKVTSVFKWLAYNLT
jgi:Sec-independent protein translocase protein TatA